MYVRASQTVAFIFPTRHERPFKLRCPALHPQEDFAKTYPFLAAPADRKLFLEFARDSLLYGPFVTERAAPTPMDLIGEDGPPPSPPPPPGLSRVRAKRVLGGQAPLEGEALANRKLAIINFFAATGLQGEEALVHYLVRSRYPPDTEAGQVRACLARHFTRECLTQTLDVVALLSFILGPGAERALRACTIGAFAFGCHVSCLFFLETCCVRRPSMEKYDPNELPPIYCAGEIRVLSDLCW